MLKKILGLVGGFFLLKWFLNKNDIDVGNVTGNIKNKMEDAIEKPFDIMRDKMDL